MATTQLRVSRPGAPLSTGVTAPQALTQVSNALRTYFNYRSTPGLIRVFQGSLLVLIALSLWAEWAICNHVRSVVKTIKEDTVHSILAAEAMRTSLADANANAVNALLSKQSADGSYWNDFRQNMHEAHDHLITAAQFITYEDKERIPIWELSDQLAIYEQKLGEVRGRLEKNSATSGGSPIDPGTIGRMNEAFHLMGSLILPKASELGEVNFNSLSSSYHGFMEKSYGPLAPAALSVGILLTLLVVTQVYFFRSTHRIINPGLALATLVTCVVGIYGLQVFHGELASVQKACHDAFDSVHALRKAQSVAYDANAQESIYLLNSEGSEKDKSEKAFNDDAAKIWQAGNVTDSNKPFLNAEMANITFRKEGEEEAAQKCIDTWRAYWDIDQRVRKLERNGDHIDAISLNLGVGANESNWAFKQFDDALNATIKINQDQFDAAMNAAESSLKLFPLWMGLAAVVMAGAVLVGLKPRLDEYRF